MPLSPEDVRLGQALRARGLVPENVLLECARDGDALEAQGRPRPRLGAQLVARRALQPDAYARFLQVSASASDAAAALRASGQLPALDGSTARQGSARLAASAPGANRLASSGTGPGISRATPSPPTPPIGTTPVPPSTSPSPEGASWRSRSSQGELPAVGSLVGAYRLEGELGRGGMGAVYRGKHERTGAVTAVKVLARKAGGQSAERFEREVQAFAKLRHPNVVAIHESGEAPHYLWYSMELVEGASLEKVIADKKTERDALVRLVLQVARGMEHAHSRGVIHRDLKPSNVLVTAPDGGVGIARITDFGAARHLDRETRLTADGSVVGTPYYMSPEQVTGTTNEIDERSDVWALGVILYEVVTNALPFEAEQPLELCAKICESHPTRPRARVRSVSADLEAVIFRALAKEKSERYQSMTGLAADLERYLKGERVSASQITLAREIVRHARRRPGRLIAGLAVASLAIVATGILVSRHGEKGGGGSGIELVQEAEREAGRTLEKIRAGKLPVAEALALATATLGRLDEVTRSPRAEAERKRLEGWPVRIELAVLRARALVTQGAEAEARAALEALGETATPIDAEVGLALGDACLALGDARAARSAFERAVARAPERWEPLLGCVRARVRAGDLGAAGELEKDLARAREKQAPVALVETARAEVLAARGDRAGALERLDQAVKLDPSLAAPRIARALVIRETGDEARALEDLHKAADRDPAAARLEARWHLEVGALADAARAYERALALVPEDVGSSLALAGLRASLGELDRASVGLLHDAIPLAESRGKVGRPALLAFLHALVPIEGARGAWNEAFAQRLDGAGLVADAALVHAELAGDPGRARALLETAAEAARVPEDRARILASLAILLLHADELAPARERADAAVAAVPSSSVARAARAAVLAAAGSLEAALADRAASRAARSPEFDRALAEARADALVILEGAGPGVSARRAEEVRRTQIPRYPFRALGPPSPELIARAEREVRYLARLEPLAPEPLVLLSRLMVTSEELGRGSFPCDADPFSATVIGEKLRFPDGKESRPLVVALAANAADPLDAEAATLILLGRQSGMDHRLVGLTKIAVAANPADRRLTMARARRCAICNEEKEQAVAIARNLAAENPRDRQVVILAIAILTSVDDPSVPGLERDLEALDAAVDRARADMAATYSMDHTNLQATLGKLLPSLETAPDDIDVVRIAIEKSKSQVKAHGSDWSRQPTLLCARLALMSGNDSGEVLKWLDTLRLYVSPEDEAAYREQAAKGQPQERLEAAMALALIDAEEPINFDSRKLAYQGMWRGAPARQSLARLAPLLAGAPGAPLVRALDAIQLARSGRLLGAAREVDRLLGWRTPTYNDLWLASAALVLGADYEGAARYALRAATLPEVAAADRRDFFDYAPFLEAAKRKEWAEIVALPLKR